MILDEKTRMPRVAGDGAPLGGVAAEQRAAILVAHLGHHLVLAGFLGQQPGLVDIVGQGLLHIDVFAAADGGQSDGRVGVVGVATMTASMSFCWSSRTRKSLYTFAFGYLAMVLAA